MEQAVAPELNKFDPNYPKVKYKASDAGDVKSPAYEKIVMRDGNAVRHVEYHPYVTVQVRNAKEEKQLGPEWVDSPADLK